MLIQCPSCGRSFPWDETSTDKEAAAVSCAHCRHSFLLDIQRGPKTPGPGEPLPRAFRWFIRRGDGTLLSFPDDARLEDAAAKGMLGLDDQISEDGLKWTRIGDMPLMAGFARFWVPELPKASAAKAAAESARSYGAEGAPSFGNVYQASLKAGGSGSEPDDEHDPREHTDEEFIGIKGRSGLNKRAQEDAYGVRADATNDRTAQDDPVLVRGRQRDRDPIEDTSERLVQAPPDRKAEMTASRESTVERPMAPEDTDHNLQALVDKSAAEHLEATAVFEDEASSEREIFSRNLGNSDQWEDGAFKAKVRGQAVNAEETILQDMRREQVRRYTILGGLGVVFLVALLFAMGTCGGDGSDQTGDVVEELVAEAPAPAAPAPEPPPAAATDVVTEAAEVQAPEPTPAPAPEPEVQPAPEPEPAPVEEVRTQATDVTPEAEAPAPAPGSPPAPAALEEPKPQPTPAPVVKEAPKPAPVAIAPAPIKPRESSPKEVEPEPAQASPGDRIKDASEINDYEDLMSAGDFYRKTDLAKALTYYQKALEIRPSSAEAPYKAGDCCYQLAKHQQAVDFFNLAIERGRYRAAYSRAAQAYKKMGDQENAVKILETGLSHYPGDPLMRSLVESYR